MKRIAIIGATGMLGSAIYGVLGKEHEIIFTYRDSRKLAMLEKKNPHVRKSRSVYLNLDSLYTAYLHNKGPEEMSKIIQEIGAVDAVINCIGIIRPKIDEDQSRTFFVNGALPHLLSSRYGKKLIHISTDCVFNGASGAPYDELSTATPVDVYGLTKFIGEPKASSLVLRTSLIGFELEGDVSLLGWLGSRPHGQQVPGYTDHIWNGITTHQCALVCNDIIIQKVRMPEHGLFHIYSKPVTKCELLKLASKRWRPDLHVNPQAGERSVDRRLTSVFPYSGEFNIPDIETMLSQLEFIASDAS